MHQLLFSNNLPSFGAYFGPWEMFFIPLIIVALLWSIYWKARALWRAARQDDKLWFVLFLFVNTLGILEIVYVYFISKTRAQSKVV